MKGKIGASFTGWTEGVLLLLVFMASGIIIVGGFNSLYEKNNDIGLMPNNTYEEFTSLIGSSTEEIEGSEVEFDQGLNVFSSWGIIKAVAVVIWNFLSGNMLVNLIGNFVVLGESGRWLALVLRVLFMISVIYIILKILFKVKA